MIESIAALLLEVFKFINTENSRKYIDKLAKIRTDLMEEKAKGQLSDDWRIEKLEQELLIVIDAAKQEITVLQAKK
jgi:hypothetical protein